jgi:hypothetical protein
MALRLTNGALKKLHEAHGIDLYNNGLSSADVKSDGLLPFVKIYWAGRLHEQANLTLEQAQADADEMTPNELMTACNEAIKQAFGVTEAIPGEEPKTKSDAAPA